MLRLRVPYRSEQRVNARAAERGLEVGGEGGAITGLSRVENAVLEGAKGGILGLLEGAGWSEEESGIPES